MPSQTSSKGGGRAKLVSGMTTEAHSLGTTGSRGGRLSGRGKTPRPGRARPSTNRRSRRPENTFLIGAHGELNDRLAVVPKGKSLIFLTRPGTEEHMGSISALRSNENVQRVLAGRFTPLGHRLHVPRYDAGQAYPDMTLDHRTYFDDLHMNGIARLPLQNTDFGTRQFADGPDGVDVADGPTMPRWEPPDEIPFTRAAPERLSSILNKLPDGKYVISACRVFHPSVPDVFRSVVQYNEKRTSRRYRPGKGPAAYSGSKRGSGATRSSPGSLSATTVSDSRGSLSSRGWASSLEVAMAANDYAALALPTLDAPLHRHRPRQRKGPKRGGRSALNRRVRPPARPSKPVLPLPSSASSGTGSGRAPRVKRARTAPVTEPDSRLRAFTLDGREGFGDSWP